MEEMIRAKEVLEETVRIHYLNKEEQKQACKEFLDKYSDDKLDAIASQGSFARGRLDVGIENIRHLYELIK